jgi:3-deoxy-manno-octulosonate cytidylyltransferase (CMP-KDO synthetase)
MNIIGIIPARMASSRFPNKPMKLIHGIPMVGHCFFRSKMSTLLSEVYVATCDEEVYDYIVGKGGKSVMTANTHERASDRAAEAILKIEKETGKKVDIVVMIQGDEPMIVPSMIDEAVKPLLENPNMKITNLVADIETVEEFEDPNEVKVVMDKQMNAIYFSREPIPSRRKGVLDVPMKKQVCIIPFQRDFLLEYNDMEQTPLEIIESVDMMRLLENGIPVKMVPTQVKTKAVDTLADLLLVEKLMEGDKLMQSYS